MAQAGVPGAAAVKVSVPGNGVVVAVGAAFVRFLVKIEQDVDFRANVFVVVPLVATLPGVGEVLCRKVGFVEHLHGGVPHVGVVGVAIEVGAYQLAIPGPVIFGVGSGVNTHKATTGLNPPVHLQLLGIVQHIARGIEKNNDVVVFQGLLGELLAIFCGVDNEIIFFPKGKKSFFANANRLVAKRGSFGEHKHLYLTLITG